MTWKRTRIDNWTKPENYTETKWEFQQRTPRSTQLDSHAKTPNNQTVRSQTKRESQEEQEKNNLSHTRELIYDYQNLYMIIRNFSSRNLQARRVMIYSKCWKNFAKCFSAAIETIMYSFPLLLIWLYLFSYTEPTLYTPGITPTYSLCIIILICCWIQFVSILLIIVYHGLQGIPVCRFLIVSFSGWSTRVMLDSNEEHSLLNF